jgi:hypothetical protein
MTQEAAALIGLAVLVSLAHRLFTATTARVDAVANPVVTCPRVRWLQANSARIHRACAGTVVTVLAVQVAVLLG